jgi:pimeloyl-ACP methyl ester carboxylesterase
MSVIVVDQRVVHYEALGRGRPVIFLHGWMGSWRYWFPTMERMSEHFRTYSFDFWGFGESRRQNGTESIAAYSNQVLRFVDALGIDRPILVGHSMGGMVALKTAIQNPKRVARVAAVGAPIVGTSLSWLLKLTEQRFLADAFTRMPSFRRFMFRQFLGVKDDPALGEILDDSVKSSSSTLHRTVGSMLRTDLRKDLPQLITPTLIVHGGRDNIVSPKQADLFGNISCAEVVVMPESHHFPFLEEADLFNDVLLRFLKQDNQPRSLMRMPLTQPSPVR